MDIQLIRSDWLITTFHIHRLRGLIKPVLAIKKQHQLVMMMSRWFRAHLSRFKVPPPIRYSIILDHSAACATANGATLESNGQFWHIRPDTIVGSKIASSVQMIRRDIDPNIYNQRL